MTAMDYIYKQIEEGTYECQPTCYRLEENNDVKPDCKTCPHFLVLILWANILQEFLEMLENKSANQSLRTRTLARYFAKKYKLPITTNLFKNQIAKVYDMCSKEVEVEDFHEKLNVLR